MSKKISQQDVQHIAKLARLKLNDDQSHHYADKLSAVLGYMNKLNQLDVADVEPMAHPTDMTNAFRNDNPADPMPVDRALANAPDADLPFFKVPKVLGDGGGA